MKKKIYIEIASWLIVTLIIIALLKYIIYG